MAGKIKKKTVRAKAQPYVEALAHRGLSANKALMELRKMGLGYRRTDFLDDYRKYLGKEKAKDVAKYIRKDRYPTEAVMITDNKNWRRKYNNFVEYTTRDIYTGVETKKTITLSWDSVKTVREVEQSAFDYIADNLDFYHSEFVGLTFTGVVKGW